MEAMAGMAIYLPNGVLYSRAMAASDSALTLRWRCGRAGSHGLAWVR